MGSISPTFLSRLLSIESLSDNVMLYDAESKSVISGATANIPWTVVLLYGGHHRKHVFSSGAQVDVKHVDYALNKLTSRIAWRYFHRNSIFPWWRSKSPASYIGMPNIIAPELEHFFVELRRQVMYNFDDMSGKGVVFSNGCKWFSWAAEWLDRNQLVALPADKVADARRLLHSKLSPAKYEPRLRGRCTTLIITLD